MAEWSNYDLGAWMVFLVFLSLVVSVLSQGMYVDSEKNWTEAVSLRYANVGFEGFT